MRRELREAQRAGLTSLPVFLHSQKPSMKIELRAATDLLYH